MELAISIKIKELDDNERDNILDELRRIAIGIIQHKTDGAIMNTQGLIIGNWKIK
jgi:hypothetical protein